ncbi:MAG: coproporphyrinogen dehydrogenase HemZ [Oscillospiraceae bacterium]|nr:coproporphyrinogen dehydrogenase HemZ [Oscillospiraceae bacterium]
MTLEVLGHDHAYEMECLVRLFCPGALISVTQTPGEPGEGRITTRLEQDGGRVKLSAAVCLGGYMGEAADVVDADIPEKGWEVQRRLSVLLFGLLCEQSGIRPPWGILTGVRPVNLCRKLMARFGLRADQLAGILAQDYKVLPEKAVLALGILHTQNDILATGKPRDYSLYVSIPFCPTRCLYCSFVSHAIDKAAKLLPDYLRLLDDELAAIGALAKNLGLRLRSVYMGGGTPTTLTPGQLRGLLSAVANNFPVSDAQEYTVEAGRPDSITREKLSVLKDFGVSRISVNPQVMDDEILKSIGRKHTSAQTLEAMALAREIGFENINMDLIAGLPGLTPERFADTLSRVIALRPENLTVHTLTVKRSSDLRAREGAFAREADIHGQLAFAGQALGKAGYFPYYLYRQQGTPHNLENTGYCLPGKEGLYNIHSMEDAHTILAAGAGGVTKLRGERDKLGRVFNYKYPYEYISGFADMLARKQEMADFFKKDGKIDAT